MNQMDELNQIVIPVLTCIFLNLTLEVVLERYQNKLQNHFIHVTIGGMKWESLVQTLFLLRIVSHLCLTWDLILPRLKYTELDAVQHLHPLVSARLL